MPIRPLHQGWRDQPSERVIAVLGLAEIFGEAPARSIAPAAILVDDGIAVGDKIAGDLGARAGCRDRRRCARSGSAPICRRGCVRAIPERARLPAGRYTSVASRTPSRARPSVALDAILRRRFTPCRAPSFRWAARPALACRRHFRYHPRHSGPRIRARSSAGEHYVDIVGVTGSIPVAPTNSRQR